MLTFKVFSGKSHIAAIATMILDTEAQYRHALSLKKERRYEQAALLLTTLALQYEQQQHRLQQANCLLEIGECHYYLTQYTVAIALFDELLGLLLTYLPDESLLEADTYENMGICYGEQGYRRQEIEYKHKALALRQQILAANDESIGQSYNNLGYAYERVGDCQQALTHFKRALQILGQHPESSMHLATCYNNIGNCYSAMGDYENALNYHHEALRYRREAPDRIPAQLWVTLNNIGFDYIHQYQYAESKTYFVEALAIAQQLWQEQPDRHLATIHNNLGVCYREQKQYAQALGEHQLALAILQQLPDELMPQQIANHCNIGEIYSEQEQYENALLHYQKALHIAGSIATPTPYTAVAHCGIGYCLLHSNNALLALQHYQQALQALLPSTTTAQANISPTPPPNDPRYNTDYTDPKTLLTAWKGKIEAICHLYHTSKNVASTPNHHLHEALDTCRQALDFLNRLRRSYQAETAKIQLTEKAFGICEQALHLIFECNAHQQSPDLLLEAFSIAEQSKALSLLANLRHAEAKQNTDIDPALLAEEQQLRADLNVLARYLQEENLKGEKANAILLNEWQSRRFACQERYERLIAQLETEYPDYYRLKYNTETASVADIQVRLQAKGYEHSLISYFIGDHEIFSFYITSHSYTPHRQAKPKDLTQQIAAFLRAIKTIDKRTYCQTAHQLYQSLALPPAAICPNDGTMSTKNSGCLTIIPDRELLYLPFDALLCQPVEDLHTPYANMPYLLGQYAVTYHYSATLWLQTPTAPTSAKRSLPSFIGFAPIHFAPTATEKTTATTTPALASSEPMTFRTLQSSTTTLVALEQLFEQRNLATYTALGEAATWANFRQYARLYRYVLLYTHADFNETQPALSRILFAPSADGSNCYMAETYALSLQADLVVLGACETGIGELKKGEGMVGINRGFLYAGANNLLFSLLKVPEQTAAQLLIAFFDRILQGDTHYTSLQFAKWQLIQQNKGMPPLAWAGWVLLGGV